MTGKIPSLNGLRAFSIICVLISHVELKSLHWKHNPGGQLGVNIFFVISGFLITYLLLKEEVKTGTISLKNFYVRRSLRVFPVFYVLLLVYFILQVFGVIFIDKVSWISSLTYTKYFFNGSNWETGHLWSLSVEEHFYLIWPLVFLFFKPIRTWFALTVVVACFAVRLITDVSIMHLFTRADAMMVGCLFALHYNKLVRILRNKSLFFQLAPFMVLIALVLGGDHLMFFLSDKYRTHMTLALAGSFGLLTNIAIGFIIIVSINYTDNLYFKIINLGAIDYLGQLSYSIYIWQQIYFSEKLGLFSKLPFNLVFIIITALLSYYLVEKPFLKLKDQFSKRQIVQLNKQAVTLQQ